MQGGKFPYITQIIF